MKRIGHVIEEIVEYSNLYESFMYIMRGNKRKRSYCGRYLLKNRDDIIKKVKERILSGTYKLTKYNEFEICERGKIRKIQSIPLIDRIYLHAIMRVVEKYINRRFIRNTAASIKGRGGKYLLDILYNDLKLLNNDVWVYKCDIRHFYENINQEKMFNILCTIFKDKNLLSILHNCINFLPNGLSIGLRSSQSLGNLYLSYYVDHYIVDMLSHKYYYRYCDDIIIIDIDNRRLSFLVNKFKEKILESDLDIKSNDQFFHLKKRPIDFLGYIIYNNEYKLLRKHIKQRFARHWKNVKSYKRKCSLIGSFYGMAKHSCSNNLFKKITNITMKEFKDFGLIYEGKDGKKFYDCPLYSLSDIQNIPLIISEYIQNIKTRQGDNRYIVLFKYVENGQEGKFFTSSDELKQMLDKISNIEEGFPFKTVIVRKKLSDNKNKYIFT